MRGNRLLLATVVLMAGTIQPTALFGQDTAAKETYDGVPLCKSRPGSYPRPIYSPDPEYDNKARKKRIQGTVILSVVVTKDGQTADIKVAKSLTPGLDEQAIKGVSRWRFEPVVRDGQPCPVRINIQVAFRLY